MAVAPPSPSLNRSGTLIFENERPFEELAFDISVEKMTPQLPTAPFRFDLDPPLANSL